MDAEGYLRQILEGTDPLYGEMERGGRKTIGQELGVQQRKLGEEMSASGLGSSALKFKAGSDITGESYNALMKFLLGLKEKQMGRKDQAIGQLAGIEQFKSQETGWGDVLGALLGQLGGSFAGGAGGAVGAKVGGMI